MSDWPCDMLKAALLMMHFFFEPQKFALQDLKDDKGALALLKRLQQHNIQKAICLEEAATLERALLAATKAEHRPTRQNCFCNRQQ